MNADDRKRIQTISNLISEAAALMEELTADLQQKADNLAETNFTERAEKAEEEASTADELTQELQDLEARTTDFMEN